MEKIDEKTEVWRYKRLNKPEDLVALTEEYIN